MYLWSLAITAFIISARKDKCLSGTATSLGTATGKCINDMFAGGLTRDKHFYPILCQAAAWWTSTKGIQQIAAYRIQPFFAVRYGDTVWTSNAEINQMKVGRNSLLATDPKAARPIDGIHFVERDVFRIP